MTWKKSVIGKLILFLILTFLISCCDRCSKTQSNHKKYKQTQYSQSKYQNTQSRYQNNQRVANQPVKQVQRRYYKYEVPKEPQHRAYETKYHRKYENKYQRPQQYRYKEKQVPKQPKCTPPPPPPPPQHSRPPSNPSYHKKIYKVTVGQKERRTVTNFIKEIEDKTERFQRDIYQEKSYKEILDDLQQNISEDNTIQIKITKIKEIKPEKVQIESELEEEYEEHQDQNLRNSEQLKQEDGQEKEQVQQREKIKRVKQIQMIQEQQDQPMPSHQCDEKPIYDYNLLVLTWVPEECYVDKDCEKDWLTAQDLRSPTIHMFRPYGSSSYFSNCFEAVGDQNCRKNAYMANFDFQQALWNTTGLLYDMSQYWPAHKFSHDDEDFYAKQWLNHGTCYLMNMIEDNPSAYKMDKAGFNKTIMAQYFKTAINKFKKLKIDVEPGKQYDSKEQFASDIGFRGKQTHFVLNCDKKNQIVQITFCYNRSKLPGRQVTIPCTFTDMCDENLPLRLKQPL